MSKDSTDPIEELIVSSETIEGEKRRILVDLLKPHVRLDPDTGAIHFLKYPPDLLPKHQVLVYLMAKLALAAYKPAYKASAKPKEISDATRLPGGTVRPALRRMLDERVIAQGEEGYFFEAFGLGAATAILTGKE